MDRSIEKRVELSLLIDFYGPLLTDHRREILTLYCNEDMSFQEIADRMSISRQGVHDAVKGALRQLNRYEKTLGLADRYQRISHEVRLCRSALNAIRVTDDNRDSLGQALSSLDRIDGIER